MSDQPETERPDHPEGYRGPQVCKIVGITYRQLDYWARTDLITPSIASAKGSGTQRIYSYRDLVELKVIKKLLDSGIALKSARKAIDYLRTELGDDIGTANLVLDGSQALLVRGDGELVDVIRRGQGVLNIVSMSGVLGELDSSIGEVVPLEAPEPGDSSEMSETGS